MVERTFDTIGEAHLWVVKYLLQNGVELITEDAAPTLESEFPVTIIVKHPLEEPMIANGYLFSNQKAQEYVKQFTQLTPPNVDPKKNFAYTYYNRLSDHPIRVYYDQATCTEMAWVGNGDGDGINQIQNSIIDRLVKQRDSRRAIAITLVPELDAMSHDPPCMQFVQCMIRDNKLNLIAYFRSNDMMSAWGANAYGLAHLQLLILKEINDGMENVPYTMGWLMTTSGSAHLYENDGMQMKEFRKVLNV